MGHAGHICCWPLVQDQWHCQGHLQRKQPPVKSIQARSSSEIFLGYLPISATLGFPETFGLKDDDVEPGVQAEPPGAQDPEELFAPGVHHDWLCGEAATMNEEGFSSAKGKVVVAANVALPMPATNVEHFMEDTEKYS